MFATSVRVRPWSARSSPRSVGRVTTISPSRCSICIRVGTRCESSPSGPFTCTRPGEIATFTEVGSSIGFFPIRLMRLPNEANDFAADAFALGDTTHDEPTRRGQDPLAAAAILQLDDQDVERLAVLDAVLLDVALLLEELRDLRLHLRSRHPRFLVQRLVGVANPGEHVGDRIGYHFSLLPTAFRHAGDCPLMCEVAQADPAQAELPEHGARAPAAVAARVLPRLEPLRAALLDDQ